MAKHTPQSIIVSIIGILVAGGCGAFAGWGLVSALGASGVAGAVLAAVTGMVVATGVWILLSLLLIRVGLLR